MTRKAWILAMDDGWVYCFAFKTRKQARAQRKIFQTSPFVKSNKIRVVKMVNAR